MNTKKELSLLCKKLYDKGFSPAKSGNISYKQENSILITPSGFCLGDVEEKDFAVVDLDGNLLGSSQKPSSEKIMHIEIYKQRPDVKCILHIHAPKITAFAVAQIPINKAGLAEAVFYDLCNVPIAKYATPSSKELALNVSELAKNNNCILMANHGVIICGSDMKDAYFRLEDLYGVVETYLWATVLGRITELTPEQQQELIKLRG